MKSYEEILKQNAEQAEEIAKLRNALSAAHKTISDYERRPGELREEIKRLTAALAEKQGTSSTIVEAHRAMAKDLTQARETTERVQYALDQERNRHNQARQAYEREFKRVKRENDRLLSELMECRRAARLNT